MDGEARSEPPLRMRAAEAVSLLAHPSRPLLVCGEWGGNVLVWDLRTRALRHTLTKHDMAVFGLAIDPDGGRLASGSNDATVRLWDLDSGRHLCTMYDRTMLGVFAVVWDAAGARVASGSYDGRVRVWDAAAGALRLTLVDHGAPVHCLAAHPDGDADLLASGSDDRTVRLWRFSSGASVRTLTGHAHEVRSLAASRRWLVSGSRDPSVRVWSWDGVCARVLDGSAVGLWRDARMVTLQWRLGSGVGSRERGTVRLWDTHAPEPREWSCVATVSECANNRRVAVSSAGVAFVDDAGVAFVAVRTPRQRRARRRTAARV